MAESEKLIEWATPCTWRPVVTDWLRPWLRPGAVRSLSSASPASSYVDDPAWLELLSSFLRDDLERIQAEIAEKLRAIKFKVFHGCRTVDAGEYFREGLQVHDRGVLMERVRRL